MSYFLTNKILKRIFAFLERSILNFENTREYLFFSEISPESIIQFYLISSYSIMALDILFNTIGITFLVCLAVLNFIISAYQVKYFVNSYEADQCEIKSGVSGTCLKISNCTTRFKTIRKNQINFKICSFNKLDLDNVICCPNVEVELNNYSLKPPKDHSKTIQKPSLLDFETCQKEFLKFRVQKINPSYFGKAMHNGIIPINKANCIKLHRLNNGEIKLKINWGSFTYVARILGGRGVKDFVTIKQFKKFVKGGVKILILK